METIKTIILWFDNITKPMVYWKYGEDGKYRHILLGFLASIVLFIGTIIAMLIVDMDPINIGLYVLNILLFGILIEVVQRINGGTNTLYESTTDTLWVGVGGVPILLFMMHLGLTILIN